MEADLRNTLAAAGYNAQYDTEVKKILARKSILSRILAATVDEFKGVDPEEIENLIDDNIIIGKVPTEPGSTNKKETPESGDQMTGDQMTGDRITGDRKTGDRIVGLNTEASELAEGTAVFDIIFYVRTKDGLSQIIINIEAQRKEPSEYDLLNRAIFYVSRMISSQKERDFTGQNYNDLKRVFSIWVCLNMDECIWNNVHLVNDSVLANHEWQGKLDLFNIVLLGMPKEIPKQDEKFALHRMISVLLSPDLTTDERMEILEDEYNIKDEIDFRKELDEMCNLSEGIYEKGLYEGTQEGMRKGALEGAREANIKTAKSLIDMKKISLQEIAQATGLKLEEVEALANLQPV